MSTTKRVAITLVVHTYAEVPDDWTDHDIEFWLNESSHCLANDLQRVVDDGETDACNVTTGHVGHVTVADGDAR